MEQQRSASDEATILASWCGLVEGSPLPMAVTVGPSHQLVCVNTALEHLLADAPADTFQHKLADVIPRCADDMVTSLLDRVFTRGIAEIVPDLQHTHPHHGTVYWTYAAWPLRVDDGEVVGLALQLRDTTADVMARADSEQARSDLREANERLVYAALQEHEARAAAEDALTVRDQFLSIASHELRTPLTSLMGYAHLLQQGPSGMAFDPKAQRILAAIERQAVRLNTLVGQLLDVARLERRLFSVDQDRLDIVDLVTRVVDDIVAAHADYTITMTHDGMPILMLGDALRLEQVVQNLVGNAVKYSPAGSAVSVRVEQQEGEVVMEVADQGIGIPAEAQAGLFTPFYRAGNGRAIASGFGIGLYVVKEIVTNHGGRITLDSTEGQGSVFRVSLPSGLGGG